MQLAGERLTTVFVPLLGAGKGGVPAEIAFSATENDTYRDITAWQRGP